VGPVANLSDRDQFQQVGNRPRGTLFLIAMPTLEGRMSWSGFFASQRRSGLMLIASLALERTCADSIVSGLFMLTTAGILLSILIWLPNLVTQFRVEDGELTFARLGRWTRTVPIADVVQVWRAGRRGASVWLRGGGTLDLCFEFLENARELTDLLQQTLQPTAAVIEGRLNRSGVAAVLVQQALATCLLAGIALVGCRDCLLIHRYWRAEDRRSLAGPADAAGYRVRGDLAAGRGRSRFRVARGRDPRESRTSGTSL
jgi:hypothetical protein